MHKTGQEKFTLQKLQKFLFTKLPNIVLSKTLRNTKFRKEHLLKHPKCKTMHAKNKNLTAAALACTCATPHIFTPPLKVRLIHSGHHSSQLSSTSWQRSFRKLCAIEGDECFPSHMMAKWPATHHSSSDLKPIFPGTCGFD